MTIQIKALLLSFSAVYYDLNFCAPKGAVFHMVPLIYYILRKRNNIVVLDSLFSLYNRT